MSGILGVWNSQKHTPWQEMLNHLKVLGQDGRGDWHDSSVGLSLGRTQFFNTPESCLETPVIEYEGCILVWDGRVDDRESLLADRTNITDAQLIIESYRRWGVDCLKHLIGEFVFILWDASNDLLFVGCDSVGGRTISYYWDGTTLLLSSRVLTLLLHPQVSKELNKLYLTHTLCNFRCHPPGLTPFAKIERLRPGFALILRSGQFQLDRVANLTTPKQYTIAKSPELQYEEFWCLLDRAVKDRLRTNRPACVALSGGLDSTTVTVSLLDHLSAIDAFSNVTTVFPEFDERQPIKSFLDKYPQVKWHDVNSDNAWGFTEPWERLPIPDDPIINCTSPMDIQLFQKMQQSGFGMIFDGDWGDNLFYANLQDLARASSWGQIIKNLKVRKRWYSTFWKELILPNAPQYVKFRWFKRWHNKLEPIPSWIDLDFFQESEIEQALTEYFADSLSANLIDSINWRRESGNSVGAAEVYRLFKKAHKLESSSPFQDKRLIKFALNLHPVAQNHPNYNKIFLRRAIANRQALPNSLIRRPKRNYFDPLSYVALGKGQQVLELLEQLESFPQLQTILNVKNLTNSINYYRREYEENYQPGHSFNQSMSSQLYNAFTFINWYQKVTNDVS